MMLWFTQVRRSLVLAVIPLVALLMVVSINSPSDSWRGGWSNGTGHLSQLSVLVDVVVALLAAWEAGRFQRSGISRVDVVAPRSEFARLLVVFVYVWFLGLATLFVTFLYMSQLMVGGGRPWWWILLDVGMSVGSFSALGLVLGTWWRSRLAAPVAAVATYTWVVYGSSVLQTGRPQSLFASGLSGTNCCSFAFSVAGKPLVASLGWSFGLTVVGLLLVYLRACNRVGLGSPRDRVLLLSAVVIVGVGATTGVVSDGGSPTSPIRATLAQRCVKTPGGVSVCDFTQLSYELPILTAGVEYAERKVPVGWIPHRLVPLPSSREIAFRMGTGFVGGLSFQDPWTESAREAATGVALSYFPLMSSCQNKVTARVLLTLQVDTQLSETLINNHVLDVTMGQRPPNVPFPNDLMWASWGQQVRFISSNLAQIVRCQPLYPN